MPQRRPIQLGRGRLKKARQKASKRAAKASAPDSYVFAALPRLRWATRTSQMARRQHVAVAACLAVFLSGAFYVAGGSNYTVELQASRTMVAVTRTH